MSKEINITTATLSLVYMKCNNDACRLCQNGTRHGPYYMLTKMHNYRLYKVYVGKNKPEDMQPYYDMLLYKIQRDKRGINKEYQASKREQSARFQKQFAEEHAGVPYATYKRRLLKRVAEREEEML